MKMIEVRVFKDIERKHLPDKELRSVVTGTFAGENIKNANINVILVDDEQILELNKQYLNHDFTTDVITFDFDEDSIAGEIYISVDTADRQAKEYGVSLKNELKRLSIHGVLHLIGYDDDTDEKREIMHQLENKYLN